MAALWACLFPRTPVTMTTCKLALSPFIALGTEFSEKLWSAPPPSEGFRKEPSCLFPPLRSAGVLGSLAVTAWLSR